MAQLLKLDVQIELKSSADKVYDIFRRKMYLMPEICPQLVKEVKIAKGDWEAEGSVRLWKYVAGTNESATETIEAIDDERKSITMKSLNGDVIKYYKTFKANVCVSDNGEGSLVKWTVIYEKENPNIPDPSRYVEFVSALTKPIDAYLLNNEEKKNDYA